MDWRDYPMNVLLLNIIDTGYVDDVFTPAFRSDGKFFDFQLDVPPSRCYDVHVPISGFQAVISAQLAQLEVRHIQQLDGLTIRPHVSA
jgi:hypothetical protein